jgi:hypothetical protein
MPSKATFLAGFATGYVLGAKAGRERYEQIREAARSFAGNPAVQSTASTLQHQAGDALSTAKDKATSTLGDKLADKRPTWMGGESRSSSDLTTLDVTATDVSPTGPVTGVPAGSNGQF